MTTDHLEEQLSTALTLAVMSVPDEPAVEWIDLVRTRPSGSSRHHAPRVPSQAVRITSVAASVLVVAVACIVTAALWPASQSAPSVLASRLLTAQPTRAAAPTAATGPWGLVSYVSDPTWHVTPEGPASSAGAITCPTSSTCYVVSGSTQIDPAVSPVPGKILNISEDGGLSWAQYRMPSGLGLTSPLVCPTADGLHCLAGGTVEARAALLTTMDGGAHWSQHLLPSGDGTPTELSCVSVTLCVGLFRTPVNPLSFGERVNANNDIYLGGTLSASIYATGNGGLTWHRADLPKQDVPQSVSCTVGRCVVIAATPTRTVPGHITRGAVFSSADSGRTWHPGTLPPGFGVLWSGPSQVDCVTVLTCWATGTVAKPDPGSSSSTTLVSAVASSADGGSTWRVQPLPAVTQPRLYSISCPTVQRCWLGGWDGPDSVTLPATSLILSTTDGGASWSRDSVGAGSGTLVGAISCQSDNVCVGLGGLNSGSGRVSVYSNAAVTTPSA